MSDSGHSRILSTLGSADLVRRQSELDTLLRHAQSGPGRLLLVSGAPGAGVSEVLRHTFDRIFRTGGSVIPIYFEFRSSDRTADRAAVRFLYNFIDQFVAFRLREPKIIGAFPDVCELREMAPAPDRELIDSLISSCGLDSDLNAEPMSWRRAFGTPLRASTYGANCFVMLDGLESVLSLEQGGMLLSELDHAFGRSGRPHVLAGKRRFISEAVRRGYISAAFAERLYVPRFGSSEAERLVESLSVLLNVPVTPQSKDLMAYQFASRPGFLRGLFEAATDTGTGLERFRDVEACYAHMLFEGAARGYFEEIFEAVTCDPERRKDLITLIRNGHGARKAGTSPRVWNKCFKGDARERAGALALLDSFEIVRAGSYSVRPVSDDPILADYCESVFRLEVLGEPYQRVFSEALATLLKRAPETMARFYRRSLSAGLDRLLAAFDCQEVPLSLLDYGIFKQFHKGKEPDEILRDVGGDLEKIKLPQIFNTSGIGAFYPPILELIEEDRAAVAFGFEHAEYSDENEIVWLAGEIDSKQEADGELAAFWCDRLEMVAVTSGFSRYRIWLVAPEGFSEEAREILGNRSAIGSSRRQADLLRAYLESDEAAPASAESGEFELVIPMGAETELIAAHAAEEISRRHSFSGREINQIKTALVEACINAEEHSMSPDGRIHLSIAADDEKISITVANRGLRFSGKSGTKKNAEERRGWGLKLMKTLMDEVRFEHLDDGTRLTLVKYRAEGGSDQTERMPEKRDVD